MIPVTQRSPVFVVRELFDSRYKGADSILLAGSVVRGEASAHSDLDLVVIYPQVETAYRESFSAMGWPVEAFVHDLETLKYFLFEVDRPEGTATLSEMIREGLEIPGPTERSAIAKQCAVDILTGGPPELTSEQVEDRRYGLSELIDDLREPRSRSELYATGSRLYNELGDFFCRYHRSWSASGKGLIKRIKARDATLARRYTESFDRLFATGDASAVVQIATDILQPSGGLLFESYRRDAPSHWRSI